MSAQINDVSAQVNDVAQVTHVAEDVVAFAQDEASSWPQQALERYREWILAIADSNNTPPETANLRANPPELAMATVS